MKGKIEINHLTKEYKNHVKALEDVSFAINSGIYGLLGHNGAGKTTLMKAIVTILQPSAGEISVCGYDTKKQGKQVRRCIGYLPQEIPMYPTLSVFDFVSYMAALKGGASTDKVKEVLGQTDMLEYANRKISQLSGGMKRRVGIAQALVGDPMVLVVDEPTAGLDPEERVRFRSVLSRFAADGKTVLLSTHIVEDIYQLCDKLAVLRKGRLFFQGSSAELMKQVDGKVKVIRIRNEEQVFELQKNVVVISTTYGKNGIFAKIMDQNNFFPDVQPVTASLEDAYLFCMGGKEYE